MRRFTGLFLCVLLGLSGIANAQNAAGHQPQGMTLRLELFVADPEKSATFYTQALGFGRAKSSVGYVPVRAGSVVIGLGLRTNLPRNHYFNPELQSARRGLGAEIVLEVDDVKASFEKVQAADAECIVSPLTRRPWGATDFRVVDPDGYYLRITSR